MPQFIVCLEGVPTYYEPEVMLLWMLTVVCLSHSLSRNKYKRCDRCENENVLAKLGQQSDVLALQAWE